MSVDSSKASPQSVDGLHNYELQDQIASGARSLVFRAICKRGRMRNRFVAVKKLQIAQNDHNDTARDLKDPVSAASLHSTLCHPTIITLISSFFAPSGYYHVLEYCEHGSLDDLLLDRRPRGLTEEELRGVARTLVDALVYLKKERVLHRDIKPSNILITGDTRLKLSGFSSAIRLPGLDATETAFCGSPNYVSPEILSGLPYRFTTDLWSVGSVLVTCLTGQPAFYAPTPAEVFDNICSARFMLPDGVSYEAKDLLAGLLQKEPEDRTPLHRILSHPFFKPTLTVQPLSMGRTSTDSYGNAAKEPFISDSTLGRRSQRYPSCLSTDPERLRPMFACKQQFASKRAPLDDITNLCLDDSQDDVNLCLAPVQIPRRATSAPTIPRSSTSYSEYSRPPTPALTADSRTPSVSSLASLRENQGDGVHPSLPAKVVDGPVSPRTQLKRVLSDPCGSTKPHSGSTWAMSIRPVLPTRATKLVMPRVSSQATSSTAVSRPGNASANLQRFSTRRLKPQTHKVSRGQLVVLPSRALLVDFRESERRKGNEGKQVLMVNPNGDFVEVYDAPHLSTPCCLAEPIMTYTPKELPVKYAKQYEDAMQIVNQLNARIPQLVYFAHDVRCTLMANGPPGDVEIHMPAEEEEGDDKGAIRLRLQRCKYTLEISRHIQKAASTQRKDVGEWTKKVIPLSHAFELPDEEWRSLDGLERLAMARLRNFLRVCEAAEAVEADGGASSMIKHGGDSGRERLERTLRHMERASLEDSARQTGASVASSMVVPPRPRKFSSTVMLR